MRYLIFFLLFPSALYAHWNLQTPTNQNLYSLWGDETNIFAVGSGGLILHSADNGSSWRSQQSGTTESLYALWGAPSVLYCVGARGTILFSNDNGETWSLRQSGTNINLRSIWGSSANDLYIVGDGGLILRSQDGVSWNKLNSTTTLNLYGIWGGSANDLYAVGEGGTILRSADAGKTWSLLESRTQELLRGIWGSGDVIYVVGYQSAILQSTDQGKTWTQQTRSTSDWLIGVWGSSANDVYAVGAQGTILHSRDGGFSWNIEREEKIPSNLYAVWGRSAEEVFLAGQGGALLKFSEVPSVELLAASSEAEGAEVWVDSTKRGVLPLSFELTVGNHQINIKKSGYKTLSIDLNAKARQAYQLPIKLEKQLFVMLKVGGPVGAAVQLDGVFRGQAPLSIDDLTPGKHVLLVQQDGFQDWSKELFVSGEELTLSVEPQLARLLMVDPREQALQKNSRRMYGIAVGAASVSILTAGFSLRSALLSENLASSIPAGTSVEEASQKVATHVRRMEIFGTVSFGLGVVAAVSAGGGWWYGRALKQHQGDEKNQAPRP